MFLNLLLVLPAMVAAFGTINAPIVLKQHNEHEMITRLAFQCESGRKSDGTCFEPRSLDQLAGHHVNVMGIAVPGAGSNGAVGAPDTLDPIPEGPEAHCDDADYLDIPGYPQSRAEANAKLQACVDHLRHRFRQAVDAADRLLDERNRVRREMVQLTGPDGGDCTFAFPSWQSDRFGRAKCSTVEGLGRALHGIQDFYAHSNWADNADESQPISIFNPPGLGMTNTAPFFDLRANGTIPADQIPLNLTTGCFALPDTSPGSGACQGRITHHSLSKDHGVINLDGTFGAVEPDPRTKAFADNFHLAVDAAVQHSREAWMSLRDEIRHHYGTVKGNLMICSLVHDNPVKDCRNRTLAVAIDNSLGSGVNGRIGVEQLFAENVNSRLSTHGLDRVALIDNERHAVLRYPMGSPIHAVFDFPEPSGDLCIAGGLELAIAETIHAQPETYTDRAAIVLLAAGADSRECHGNTLVQLQRAAEEGIRVHYACINTPPGLGGSDLSRTTWVDCSLGDALVPAVLKTGGIAASVGGLGVRTPAHFANLVLDRGLTATDDPDEEEEAARHTRVYPNITLSEFLSPEEPTKSFVYPVTAGEHINFTASSLTLNGQGPEACFSVTLWYKYPEITIATHTRCGDSSPLSLMYEAAESFDIVLEAEYEDTTPKDDLLHREEILFAISVDTDMPDKNETTVKRTTSILSSSEVVEMPSSATQDFLTSETVEIRSSTATIDGSTSIGTESFKVADDGSFAFRGLPTDPPLTCSIPTITAAIMASNLSEFPACHEPFCDAARDYRILET